LEDLSEAEKIAELLPISVQQLFVLCQLGKLRKPRLAAEITISGRSRLVVLILIVDML
jgi:hypothetical protein